MTFNLQLGKLKIPLDDIAAVSAGFYIGYQEGKGGDTSVTTELLTKFGPTAFTVGTTPLFIKMGYNLNTFALREFQKYVRECKNSGHQIAPRAIETIAQLESRLETPPEYLRKTVKAGSITAFETIVGYVFGRLYSQVS